MYKCLYLGCFLLLLISCGEPAPSPKLQIATAASTQFAVNALAEEFSAQTGLKTQVISAASGRLTTQILNGAPFDIFFAADMSYPERLQQRDQVEGDVYRYGYGIPVLWTMYESLDLDDLSSMAASEDIHRIAIANPKNAPYGEMAVKFLVDQGIYDDIVPKLVYGESISQVNEYVLRKTVELAISAKSIVVAPQLEGMGKYLPLAERHWIAQGMVVLKNDTPTERKQRFLAFVRSAQGQAILSAYGLN